MNEYSHILVALDLTSDSKQIIDRAYAQAQLNKARLSLIHVLEPLGYAYGGDIPMDLTEVQNQDRKSTRLNSSHVKISYAVFCLKKKKRTQTQATRHETRETR